MRITNLILLAISAIALILAALVGIQVLSALYLGVGGKGLCEFSAACSLLAIAFQVIKPFEKKEAAS
jgi:hypothetical protein